MTKPLTLTLNGPDSAGKTAVARFLAIASEAQGHNITVPANMPRSFDFVDGDRLSGGVGHITPSLAEMCREIHASNVAAGWWTDLQTNESTLSTRNRPEMLMLAVSELAEAGEGVFGQADDKLPHLPMYDVELGDFVIRQLDQIGGEVSLGAEMPNWASLAIMESDLFSPAASVPDLRAMSRGDRLLELVKIVCLAMEYYRKGLIENYVRVMAKGVLLTFSIAEIEHIDLLNIIAQKRAFNAMRADHKVENRVKDGGKAF